MLFRATLTSLILGLTTLAAPAVDLSTMTDAERQIFREEVRDYLMENPQVILDAVQALEDRQAEAQAEMDFDLVADNAEAIFDDGFSWVGGNPNGDITLVEFMDYRCGFCRRAHNEVATLLEQDGNIRWIVKEFPILGEQSLLAARFAVATKQIAGTDAYGVVHDALMTMNSEVNEMVLRRLAGALSLDADAIFDHMPSAEVSDELRATRELANRLLISGTPTFVLQDELIRGFVPAEQMLDMVNDKRG